MTDWGYQIRRRRRMLDLSQDQLAKKAGVSVATIRRWESGKGMTMESAEIVLEALGMKLQAVRNDKR